MMATMRVEDEGAIAMSGEVDIRSLQSICISAILPQRKYQSVEGAIQLCCQLDLSSTGMEPLKKYAQDKVRSCYPYIVANYNLAELKQHVSEIDWDSLQAQYEAINTEKARFAHLKGTVLERKSAGVDDNNAKYYPLAALVSGVAWPSNVDPINREKWLSDDEFYEVFDMTKRDFYDLPRFKRTMLKKEFAMF
jgi:hypothetical protein